MKLRDTILVAAYTARSHAYVESMYDAKMRLRGVVLYGEDRPAPWNVYYPGALAEKAHRLTANVATPAAASINSDEVIAAIIHLKPKLIIYSGAGGEIVGNVLLSRQIPVLHIHAGYLPSYRGSTTVYYSLLREKRAGVSGILLSNKIDCGTVMAKKWFAPPSNGENIDYVYDPMIRAQLLVEILAKYARSKKLIGRPQIKNTGTMYYVIHPILKHIAMLQLTSNENYLSWKGK